MKTIEQKILFIGKTHMKVISKKGNEYFVKMSDKIRLSNTATEGDTAVVSIFDENWIVTDIIQKTPVTSNLTLNEQRNRFKNLYGGY